MDLTDSRVRTDSVEAWKLRILEAVAACEDGLPIGALPGGWPLTRTISERLASRLVTSGMLTQASNGTGHRPVRFHLTPEGRRVLAGSGSGRTPPLSFQDGGTSSSRSSEKSPVDQ